MSELKEATSSEVTSLLVDTINDVDERETLSSAVVLGAGVIKLVAVTTPSEEIPSVAVTTEVADKMGDSGEPISLVVRGVDVSVGEVFVEVLSPSEEIGSDGVGVSIKATVKDTDVMVVLVVVDKEVNTMVSLVSVGEILGSGLSTAELEEATSSEMTLLLEATINVEDEKLRLVPAVVLGVVGAKLVALTTPSEDTSSVGMDTTVVASRGVTAEVTDVMVMLGVMDVRPWSML